MSAGNVMGVEREGRERGKARAMCVCGRCYGKGEEK